MGNFFSMFHALRYDWWGKETFEMFHAWGYIGWEDEILKMLLIREILGGKCSTLGDILGLGGKERVTLPNRMNFRKNFKRPHPHFRKIMLQIFMIDMVA